MEQDPEDHPTDYGGYKYRCGYCGTKGASGRCPECGSGMDHEAGAMEGARWPHLILRWLSSRDRGWNLVSEMRIELHYRAMEDLREGRDPRRFDGLPDPQDLEDNELALVMKRGDGPSAMESHGPVE